MVFHKPDPTREAESAGLSGRLAREASTTRWIGCIGVILLIVTTIVTVQMLLWLPRQQVEVPQGGVFFLSSATAAQTWLVDPVRGLRVNAGWVWDPYTNRVSADGKGIVSLAWPETPAENVRGGVKPAVVSLSRLRSEGPPSCAFPTSRPQTPTEIELTPTQVGLSALKGLVLHDPTHGAALGGRVPSVGAMDLVQVREGRIARVIVREVEQIQVSDADDLAVCSGPGGRLVQVGPRTATVSPLYVWRGARRDSMPFCILGRSVVVADGQSIRVVAPKPGPAIRVARRPSMVFWLGPQMVGTVADKWGATVVSAVDLKTQRERVMCVYNGFGTAYAVPGLLNPALIGGAQWVPLR